MFQIAAAELKRITNLLGRFLPKRYTVPILDCAHIWWGGGYVEWTATDLDAWLTVVTDVGAEGEGAVCVPHRALADIAGRGEGEIAFAVDGEQVVLRVGRARFELRTCRADEYPERPQPKTDLATLPAVALASSLRRVAPCAGRDASRPALTAVCWDGGVMVATDGTRLAVREGAPDAGRRLMIPGRTAQLVAAMLPEDGEVLAQAAGEALLFFSWRDDGTGYRVVSRQIAAPYPDWRAVVPQSEPVLRAVVGRRSLADALARLAALERGEKWPKVAMDWGEGHVVLSAESDAGRGQETVECEEMEGELRAPVAIPLTLDGLRLAEADRVEVRGWGPQTVLEMRAVDGEAWRYYWLPMREGG